MDFRSLRMKKNIKGIGEITFRKSHLAKRISIKIHSGGLVEAVLPVSASFRLAEKFVIEKSKWIREKKEKYAGSITEETCFFPGQTYQTKGHRLFIVPTPSLSDKIKAKIENGKIQIEYPAQINIRDKTVQDTIKYALTEALRIEAKQYLPARLYKLAESTGFSFNRVFLKNNKTLWGSCSAANNINLNIHLMRLPAHLADYVMIHELVHTVHKNHGPAFWKEIDRILGNGKKVAGELRKYSLDMKPGQFTSAHR